ncbi:F-box protein 22 [Vigna unguiculata]|uniref:F-box protein 22 n=2 Tax=Vigna unguiculata TaxID=3917 RepID=A0A4D6NSW5_VIGUN|nr:F-box protein 22 [Vigna unguiculata]
MEGESSSSREAKEAKKMPILLSELIIEILLRLPVKSLVRFKCVCKSWLSLLSDPYFAISHFQRLTAASTARLLLIAPPNPGIRSIDFNASLHDDSAMYTLNLDFLSPNDYSDFRIVGSCRGFLLLNSYQSLWVWNPSTGVHRKLPSTLIESNFKTFLLGFGYDPSADDYLVVKASSYDNPMRGFDKATNRVEFFSLKTNVWRDVEANNLSYVNYNDDIKGGALLNGAIHWFAFPSDVRHGVIVVFDLTGRSLSEMLLPDELLDHYDLDTCELLVLGDLLSISFLEMDRSVEIWMMEEYGVESSWTLTIVVSAEDIPADRFFFPICYTRGGDIFGTDASTGLAKYNDMGELQEHRSYCNRRDAFEVAVYTESLFSFPM